VYFNINNNELRKSFLAQLFEPSRKNLLIFRSFSARQPAKVASKSAPATISVIGSLLKDVPCYNGLAISARAYIMDA